MLFKAAGAPLVVQIAVAAAGRRLLGFAVGLLTMRMQGIFFSIATIALTIVIETSVTNWRYVGGAAGIQLQRPPVTAPFDSYVQMLFFVQALLVVLAVAIARYIQNSWIGRGLQALRDDELAAECTGVPTLRLKLLACVDLRRPDVRGRRARPRCTCNMRIRRRPSISTTRSRCSRCR